MEFIIQQVGYEASLGRWGINLFDSLRNNIAIPFITTLISILLMGLINILLIELFEIKNKIFQVLMMASVIASPSLCMTLLYAYTADAYLFAMFFSVLTIYALYRIKNKKIGISLAGISFIMMLSTYQSYMGLSIGIILMLNIKKLLTKENSSIEVIKDLSIKAIILVISAIVYYIITIVYLKINHLSMSTYKGTNEIGLSSILVSLIPSIKSAYMAFFKYFFADGIILNRAWKREKLYAIFFLLLSISIIVLWGQSWKQKQNKKDFFVRWALGIFLIAMLPIALNIVVIIASGNEIYFLIATQMLLMVPFAFMILEQLLEKNNMINLLNWGAILTLTIITITYFLSVVVTYQTTQMTYEQAQKVANRILIRMEETLGYRSGMNKLFAGVIDDVNFPKTLDIYNLAVTNSLRSSIFHATYWGQEATWRNFMEVFCGIRINFCEDYEYYKIIHSDEFKQMDIFPGENSVKMIDDVMVVKFTNMPANPPPSENLVNHEIYVEEEI